MALYQRERMGIEPTRDLSPDPSLVLKTRGGTAKTPENKPNPSHQRSLAPSLLHDTCKTDPELAEVVAAWPELPAAIRGVVVALVRQSAGQDVT